MVVVSPGWPDRADARPALGSDNAAHLIKKIAKESSQARTFSSVKNGFAHTLAYTGVKIDASAATIKQ
jgi:hypothetical protein